MYLQRGLEGLSKEWKLETSGKKDIHQKEEGKCASSLGTVMGFGGISKKTSTITHFT